MIKVGDEVRVINWGREYSTYWEFFEEHDIPIGYAARYAYCDSSNFERFGEDAGDTRIFSVLQVVDDSTGQLALISSSKYSGKIYLINPVALELVIPEGGRPMTVDEIEKELGYKVKIINEKNNESKWTS